MFKIPSFLLYKFNCMYYNKTKKRIGKYYERVTTKTKLPVYQT